MNETENFSFGFLNFEKGWQNLKGGLSNKIAKGFSV